MRLLDFYADWCGPCKVLKPLIKQLEEEFPDITITAIDAEEDEASCVTYDVRNLPTIIAINDSGEVLSRTSGGKTYPQLKQFVEECLNM